MTNKIKDLDKVKIGFADIKIERVEPSFKKSNTDCWGQYLSRENKKLKFINEIIKITFL